MAEQEPGAAQKAKGLAKEAAGTVMGDEEMKAARGQRSGKAARGQRSGKAARGTKNTSGKS